MTTSTATRVYSPEGHVAPSSTTLAPAPASLSGKRVVVLDNGKPNAALVMSQISHHLGERAGSYVGPVVKKGPGGRSANAAIPCAPDMFERVLANADVVLTGTADCGSCTAYSVYDAIQLERAGVPSVVVTTTMFEPVARTLAADFGMPDLRLVVLPHPLGGTRPEVLDAWAQDAIDAVSTLLSA